MDYFKCVRIKLQDIADECDHMASVLFYSVLNHKLDISGSVCYSYKYIQTDFIK